MLGRVELTADVVLVNPAAFTLVTGAAMLFHVEEEEMLVDLYANVPVSNTINERTDLTLFVDGANIGAANGLAVITPEATDEHSVYVNRTVRLAKGSHILDLRVKAPTGDVTIEAATIPCELVARRHSHPATLGHGVDSKAQLIQ